MSIYIWQNNRQYGPYEESYLREWLQKGQCSPNDLAWRAGMNNWQPLYSVLPGINSNQTLATPRSSALAARTPKPTPLYYHLIAIPIAFVCFAIIGGLISGEVSGESEVLGALRFVVVLLVGGAPILLRDTQWASPTGLRALVCWQIGLTITAIFLDLALKNQIPLELQQYHAISGAAWGIIGLVFLIALIISWVGLLSLWPPTRFIYAAVSLLGIVATVFYDPHARVPLVAAIDSLDDIITGAVLILLFALPKGAIFSR